jgi:protein arginine N-methyltransferase 3
MVEYRALVGQQFDAGRLAEIVDELGLSSIAGPTQRGDDSRYFSGYYENGV